MQADIMNDIQHVMQLKAQLAQSTRRIKEKKFSYFA